MDYLDVLMSLSVRAIGVCEKCRKQWDENYSSYVMKISEIGYKKDGGNIR